MTFNRTNASILRKYIYEFAIIGLSVAIVTIFWQMNSLNTFIREKLMQDNNDNRKAIEQNTNALNNFINYNQNSKR